MRFKVRFEEHTLVFYSYIHGIAVRGEIEVRRNHFALQGAGLQINNKPRVARFALTLGYCISRFQREDLGTKSALLHQGFDLRIAAAEVAVTNCRIDGVAD